MKNESTMRRSLSRARTTCFALALGTLTTVGCASGGAKLKEPTVPLTEPQELCTGLLAEGTCRTAASIEALLRAPDLEIVDVSPTPGGMQGARVFTVRSQGVAFRAKWRPAESAGIVNEPRRELVAYEVQKLVLQPRDYVVPPASARCLPLGEYQARVDAEAESTFGGASCVLGYLSYWLGGVEPVEDAIASGRLQTDEGMLDERLFEENPVYQRSVANLNLLTFLIDHGDAHGSQFLVSTRKDEPWVFSVDNSISIEAMHNPMLLFRQDWAKLQVPALAADSVEALRDMKRSELDELAVMTALGRHRGGLVPIDAPQLRSVDTPTEEGVRWVDEVLVIGLTSGEADALWSERRDLMAAVEQGEVGVQPMKLARSSK